MRSTVHLVGLLLLVSSFCTSFIGCVEESPTPVVFDQELKSVTFENRLFTPILIFRDGMVIDTLSAIESRTFPLNRRGIIRHGWQIVPPRGVTGRIAGISPYIDLGIQYDIEAHYTIRSTSVPGHTIFTPSIANFSLYDLRLDVNYGQEDEFLTDYVIPRYDITSETHAPYFYWHSNSNIYLDLVGGLGYYRYSRKDSGEFGLKLETGPYYGDAGATSPITVR